MGTKLPGSYKITTDSNGKVTIVKRNPKTIVEKIKQRKSRKIRYVRRDLEDG